MRIVADAQFSTCGFALLNTACKVQYSYTFLCFVCFLFLFNLFLAVLTGQKRKKRRRKEKVAMGKCEVDKVVYTCLR